MGAPPPPAAAAAAAATTSPSALTGSRAMVAAAAAASLVFLLVVFWPDSSGGSSATGPAPPAPQVVHVVLQRPQARQLRQPSAPLVDLVPLPPAAASADPAPATANIAAQAVTTPLPAARPAAPPAAPPAALLSTSSLASSNSPALKSSFQSLGCLHVPAEARGGTGSQRTTSEADDMTPARCGASCQQQGYRIFGLDSGTQCWCQDEHLFPSADFAVDAEGCTLPCGGDAQEMCGGKNWRTNVFRLDEVPETITLYIAPAKRTSSLFLTGRLEPYYSPTYAYRRRSLNAALTRSLGVFWREVCERTPGKKIFVQVAGVTDFILSHWPDNSIFVLTADETGNWGLGDDRRRFGPHGPDSLFASNESSPYYHILLPKGVLPFFKQYYNHKQWTAFGSDVRFIPLGSRTEYASIAEADIVPAPARQYVYSYMVAITDATREKVWRLLVNDTSIPEDKRFIHVSQNWHGNAVNSEYVAPEEYRRIMINSVFAICPKGHSVEQFRIYEALEAGAIPVLEKAGDYLSQHLPASYLSSPLLLVESWNDLVPAMLELWRDPERLHSRQQAVRAWYHQLMRNTVLDMERELERKRGQHYDFCRTKIEIEGRGESDT